MAVGVFFYCRYNKKAFLVLYIISKFKLKDYEVQHS